MRAKKVVVVYGTCVCIYCVLQADANAAASKYVSLGLVGYSTAVTLVYVQIRRPVFHQVAYALEVAVIMARSMMHQIEVRKTDRRAYSELVSLFWLGAGSFGAAFVLWNIDNIFCSQLRAVRAVVPAVLAPLFQLHAHWHIGTALGCYASIVYQQYLRLVKLGVVDNYRIRKLAFVVPYIDSRHKVQ
ncbi:alkaline ceramidase ydc1 [Coemansia nantahalensis]|uniref:Alkaline ceramidase ydc1 n=2 Tax=Coemansia TaxID=4863 RepID=A0ACC1KTH8_9FUNG|nr:alkaline ceramidase ydc1 [Coemansia nantahalensis]KAJ2794399.1 alkaline ceramidase ydc1 [Coemansia helicoidea]